ncbi:hypothetical protein BSKO_06303 [Bryopsis sp. KO-2023]|nr:hypothetical protein BSKO_06303 [Bryopsis sp. KO-2023]
MAREEDRKDISVIHDSGPSSHSCGYCGNPIGFHSHGMHAKNLTVYDYQDLLDGGWRRSGTYLYKPDLSKMCCPTYTIRLDVNKFTPSKAQKKVARRLERFLAGDGTAPKSAAKKKRGKEDNNGATQTPAILSIQTAISEAFRLVADEHQFQTQGSPPLSTVKPLNAKQLKLAPKGTEYTSSCPFALFAFLKKNESTHTKLPPNPITLAEILASKFNSSSSSSSSDFVAHAEKGHLNFSSKDAAIQGRVRNNVSTSSDFNVSQTTSTNSPDEQPGSEMEVSMERQDLEIRMAPSSLIEEEYQLYKKYQMAVHGDASWECSQNQYVRFLVSSPLTTVSKEDDPSAPECGYGAFHMQYRVGGKLIAVGVVDVLPRCLSSKYLFWDPDFASWSLGRVSALKEIEWIQEASKLSPELKYYYMGYYIHSCPKMKYKGEYSPSELMCPVGYQWVVLTDSVRKQLEESKFTVLSELPGVKMERNRSYVDEGEEVDLDNQLVSLTAGCVRWGYLKERVKEGSKSVIDSVEESIRAWRLVCGAKGMDIGYCV